MKSQLAEPIRFNTRQAAEHLRVAVSTLWAYVNAGLILPNEPNGRGPGKRVYFDADEIRAFAKKGAAGAKAYREKRDAQC